MPTQSATFTFHSPTLAHEHARNTIKRLTTGLDCEHEIRDCLYAMEEAFEERDQLADMVLPGRVRGAVARWLGRV